MVLSVVCVSESGHFDIFVMFIWSLLSSLVSLFFVSSLVANLFIWIEYSVVYDAERKNEVPYGREFFLGRREKDRFVRMLLPVLEKAMFSTSSDLRKFAQLGYKYLSRMQIAILPRIFTIHVPKKVDFR